MDVLAAYRELVVAMLSMMPHYSEHMPPYELRLIDVGERIPTPVNSYGLIDVTRLVQNVRATIDENYAWSTDLSGHHIHWPEAWYPYALQSKITPNPARFRSLPPNIIFVSREFENWLHEVTIPAKPPEEEVMKHVCDAWDVGQNLYKIATRSVAWERRARRRRAYVAANPSVVAANPGGEDVFAEEYFGEILARNGRILDSERRRNATIPPQFRFVNLEAPVEHIGRELGKLCVPRHRILKRATTQPASLAA